MENVRVESINFLRIASMILILLFHSKIHYGLSVNNQIIDEIIGVGAIGVTIFFMISGYSLRKKYSTLSIQNMTDIKKFFKKRIIAIYPMYVFLLIISFLFQYNTGETCEDLLSIIPIQLSLLQVLFYPLLNNYSFNNNFWFVSALFVLYVFFPFLNEVINNIKKNHNKIILGFFLLAVSQYSYYINIHSGTGNAFLFYYVNPIFRIPEFTIGILLADLSGEEKYSKFFGGGDRIIVASVLFVLGIHFMYPIFALNFNLYNIIVIPFVDICILCMTNCSLLNKLGKHKMVKYISELGLGIYLCQSLALLTLEKMSFNLPPNITFILLTIIYALLIHEIIEKPVSKYLIKKLIKDL